MNFREYQKEALKAAIYPGQGELTGMLYAVLGMCSESGEVAGKIKKIIREKNGEISDEDVANLSKEIGDVIWYLSTLCTELGISFQEVAVRNIEKLASRQERGTLLGNGDDR